MWKVCKKDEILPAWRGKWKHKNYACVYAEYMKYEVNTAWLLHNCKKNRNLNKVVEKACIARTQSVFMWFENKNGVRIELSKTSFFKKIAEENSNEKWLY